MEARKFDNLTRALASGTSRRGMLKGMVGSAIGGALGMLGVSRTLAQDDCPNGKVDICHRTHSARNPYNYISICSDSLEDHLAHGDTYCEGNFVLGEECDCICGIDQGDCGGGEVFDPETCSCQVPCDLTCEGNFVLDEEACECVCPLTAEDCPEGSELNVTACVCDLTCTTGFICGNPVTCGDTSCLCTAVLEGGAECVGDFSCSGAVACQTSADCEAQFGPGSFCQAPDTGCCGQVCIPAEAAICSATAFSAQSVIEGGSNANP